MADGRVPLQQTGYHPRRIKGVGQPLRIRGEMLNRRLRYENEDIALNTGMILRDMLRHEPLAKMLIEMDEFYTFPHYIEDTTFGISCDAFTNFKETLTRHKPMVALYLEANYDKVRTIHER